MRSLDRVRPDATSTNIAFWRRNFDGGVESVIEKRQTDALHVFVRFLEATEAVQSGLSEKVLSPDSESKENIRESHLGFRAHIVEFELVTEDVSNGGQSITD